MSSSSRKLIFLETVSYQLQGTLVHTCMSGVEGVLTGGDAQWMTAGDEHVCLLQVHLYQTKSS